MRSFVVGYRTSVRRLLQAAAQRGEHQLVDLVGSVSLTHGHDLHQSCSRGDHRSARLLAERSLSEAGSLRRQRTAHEFVSVSQIGRIAGFVMVFVLLKRDTEALLERYREQLSVAVEARDHKAVWRM